MSTEIYSEMLYTMRLAAREKYVEIVTFRKCSEKGTICDNSIKFI